MGRPLLLLRCLAAFAAASLPLALDAAAAPPTAPVPAPTSIVLLPTAIAEGTMLRPVSAEDGELGRLARSVDALLGDTAQDLGLAVVPPPPGEPRLADADLVARALAAGAPAVLPSLRATPSGDVELRVALADPGTRAVDARRAQVSRADLPVRAVILLRDLVQQRAGPASAPALGHAAATGGGGTPLGKSPGKISLMADATLFGGFVGVSIQLASGSTDPRVMVPLIVVGAGIGLGASFLASGEWEVGLGDAWYFAAGASWPSAAGHLIFQGRFASSRTDSDRWVFGLLGGGAGVTIASLGLALHPMSEGGAVMAHSGGGLGLAFGALVELGARGDLRQTPFSGMGYGAALGWLVAAAVATQEHAPPLRVAAFDLGAALGGLAGAGLGSPLLAGSASEGRQRAWAGIAAGSMLAGGVTAAVLTRGRFAERHARLPGLPMLGVLGESRAGAASAAILGVGWSGVLE